MKNILIHGLGQNETSWNMVEKELNIHSMNVEKPNLYSMIKDTKIDYSTLYKKFAEYCNSFNEQLNLCGLSLGGILALDYAKEFLEKVNSLILIGTPYQIPKYLFKLQGVIFHIMPKSTFEKIGCTKKDFMSLVSSMSDLDIGTNLDKIDCKTLILCGIKDNQNMENAKLLNENIKNSYFKTIGNASHEVNVDNPKELANIIYDFWREIQE
jgi:pimeloyl-ACP methyl ester carboxylesterase